MSRIQDYPEATSMADDDILVIDGDSGTRKVKKSKFVEIISEHVDGEISEMRQDFQDGVDTIYNAIVAEGVTPASSTPQACAAGIATVADNEYNAGRSQGRSDVSSQFVFKNDFGQASPSSTSPINFTGLTPNHYYILSIMSNDSSTVGMINIASGGYAIKRIGWTDSKSSSMSMTSGNLYKGMILLRATSNNISIQKITGNPTYLALIEMGLSI